MATLKFIQSNDWSILCRCARWDSLTEMGIFTLHSCLLLPVEKSERGRKLLHLRQNRIPLGGSGMGPISLLLACLPWNLEAPLYILNGVLIDINSLHWWTGVLWNDMCGVMLFIHWCWSIKAMAPVSHSRDRHHQVSP